MDFIGIFNTLRAMLQHATKVANMTSSSSVLDMSGATLFIPTYVEGSKSAAQRDNDRRQHKRKEHNHSPLNPPIQICLAIK
jgi:hypothetical protein